MTDNQGSFPSANFVKFANTSQMICQIYAKPNHTANAYHNCYNEHRYPTPPPSYNRGRDRGRGCFNSRTPDANVGWYSNTSCTDHVTPDATVVQKMDSLTKTPGLTVVDGSLIPISQTGSSTYSCYNNSLKLNNILVASAIRKNLLSVRRL